jgi:D-glycero-alpha-D-manno-heptose-7-phosphate kinase
MPDSAVEASAPARIDLAGGTLDLWPLYVLHPGSVTVNLAINRRASCRVRRGRSGYLVTAAYGEDVSALESALLLRDHRTALVGALIQALEVHEPLDIELSTEVPFGSGLGGSSALVVALLGATEELLGRRVPPQARVDFVRDVETRVLGKPAGVQDYYPALEGGLHRLKFAAGMTTAQRMEVDPDLWERHLTLFDTGAAHSSGMNNWEVFRARLEGDRAVADRLEEVRIAAEAMERAVLAEDFEAMGRALGEEWSARRRLAPVVSSPAIERAIEAAVSAGAWAGKACGAGGGGCVVLLSPSERTGPVREALRQLAEGAVLDVRVELEGLRVGAA